MCGDGEASARDETVQALLSRFSADAAAGILVGVMERYNVLQQVGVTDYPAEDCLGDGDQFVAELLMEYYNGKR